MPRWFNGVGVCLRPELYTHLGTLHTDFTTFPGILHTGLYLLITSIKKNTYLSFCKWVYFYETL